MILVKTEKRKSKANKTEITQKNYTKLVTKDTPNKFLCGGTASMTTHSMLFR